MLITRYRRSLITLSTLSAVIGGAVAAMALIDPCIYVGKMESGLRVGSAGFDLMTLIVSVLLCWCLSRIHSGSGRAWLMWTGLQAYLLYAYALYAFGMVYTAMYPFYVGVVGLSVFSLALFWRAVDARVLEVISPRRAARRLMAGALIGIAALFTIAWAAALIDAIIHGEDLPAGSVIVLDLAFTLPLLVVTGILLLRERPLGYLLTPGAFVLSTAVMIGVAFGELVRPLFGGEFAPTAFVLYLTPGLACAALAWLAYRQFARALTVPLCRRLPAPMIDVPEQRLIRRNFHAAHR